MTTRQRIEGTLHRSLPATLTIREAVAGQPEDGLLRLRLSVSSEAPYLRNTFWEEPWVEVLGHNADEIDMTRLNDGAPVLANHDRRTSYGNTPLAGIGAVERAWLEGGRIMADLIISRREALSDLRQDIADGLVRNVSIGYMINERTLTKANGEGKPNEYRVTSWTPFEISPVDIPADASVGLGRSADTPNAATQYRVVDLPAMGLNLLKGDITMKQENTTAEENQAAIPPAVPAEAVRAAPVAVSAPAVPVAAIREAVRVAGFEPDFALDMIERGLTIETARTEIFARMSEKMNANPQRSASANIIMIGDETETRREFMAEAILYRANPSRKLSDGANQFAGLSMIELARDCLEISGVRTRGMNREKIATRAFESTSDLPSVLAAVANKSLRDAYEAAPRTFTPWARQASAADFKTISRTNLSDAPALEKVNENGEFKRGSVTDGKETYQLATVGKIIGLTRQAIINDDLSSFTRIPAMFAMAAANYESDTVYGILTANAALSDTVALFEASTHKNLTGTGTVLSVTSLGVARTLMRKQTTPQGAVMNLQPQFLIVPAALETIANQFVSQAYIAAQSSNINPFAGTLQVIPEARLDAASATAWYLAAANAQIDTVEYCYLEGQSGVYIETRQGFDVDGMEIKARLDFAAKAIDYRGLYKNVGA